MPVSEIDAIFASKGKGKAPPTPSSSSAQPEKKKKKKKSKDKVRQGDTETSAKRKRDPADAEDAAPSKPPKRQVPETVFDPSAGLASATAKNARPAKAEKSAVSVAKHKKPKKDREEEDRFKDSRGTGPRTSPSLTSTCCRLICSHRSQDRGRVLDLQGR